MNTRYWIGVASKDHVDKGKTGGFCQLCHGKAEPLKRMHRGDWLIYYSPKEKFHTNTPYQHFTAVGQIIDDQTYSYQMSENFILFRRNIHFLSSQDVAIHPLISSLQFIKNKKSWGMAFRYGFFEISQDDFQLITTNMMANND
ncbi:EVE domain-containing protein [Neisseria sp. Ec49-e6-T10]|uniref:EVE domain-containing protein n=1 Tax=Neisseria sp. Ec49-e6-T10 TaxID=3140744 RepID=UPI003EBB1C67